MARELGVPLVFKASLRQGQPLVALDATAGPASTDGLAALAEVRAATGLPVLTDVHEAAQAEAAAEVVDVLQVPAFLCRQTDLLLACGRTGKPVNIKKGQFMAPHDMGNVVEKVRSTGNRGVTAHRARQLVRLQQPRRGPALVRDHAPFRARWCSTSPTPCSFPAGSATPPAAPRSSTWSWRAARWRPAVDAVFAEVHDDPPNALSDAPTQLSPEEFRTLVTPDARRPRCPATRR